MSLRDWFRRRTPVEELPLDPLGPSSPPIPQEGFLVDWRAGDLGRCMINGTWFQAGLGLLHSGPKKGQVVRVTGVAVLYGCSCLCLRGWTGHWQASCFRKIDERGEEAWLGAVKRRHAPKGKELTDA
jgi:hypothetical protein